MATGTLVFMPSNVASIIPEGQGLPNNISQPAGTLQYIQFVPYGNQQHNNSSNPSQQNPRMETLGKLLKKEIKTLGAIQVMNGLIHVGFGIVSTFLIGQGYRSLAILGGYPFWAGLSQPVIFVPYTVSENVVASSEGHPSPPPAYNAEDSSPKRE
ncbi:hypothetical protein JD844_022129 [Phrynosoma platyrhinos]|uniref:Uncharacterized protein n=1 Tax=Phrynosoma platyrhinos TaxID=52577 RepID=A0ABQ7SUS7_PHRPL|nr:hypothetical protein JD844_022129 [Phrynosoma platyrhinos]